MTKAKNNNAKTTKSTKIEKKSTKTVTSTKKPKQNVPVESAANELRKLSTILIAIVGIICIFYIITIVVTKKNQSLQYQLSDEISEISYTDILASDILKKGGSYYVLVEDSTDVYISLFKMYISSYTTLDNHLPVYFVDLNNAFNKNYKADQNNFSLDNLRFKGTVLLKVVNENIESIYETSESINEHLKYLVSE